MTQITTSKGNTFNLPFKPLILADSTSFVRNRLTTILISFPTAKLAELRTHRILYQYNENIFESWGNESDLSMNANSSRAIPIEKQIKDTQDNLFVPIWTKEQKGMNGSEYKDDTLQAQLSNDLWRNAFVGNAKIIFNLKDDLGTHKQDSSLLLNPFGFTSVLLTGDEMGWQSFFDLRCKDGVYPAVREIAFEMQKAYLKSKPTYLEIGEWHYPYKEEIQDTYNPTQEDALLICMSKCALISFDNHTQEQSKEKHITRANKMIEAKHQVAEHCYQVPTIQEIKNGYFDETYQMIDNKPFYHKGIYHSNIKGWTQLRKKIEHTYFMDNLPF